MKAFFIVFKGLLPKQIKSILLEGDDLTLKPAGSKLPNLSHMAVVLEIQKMKWRVL